MTQRRQVTQLGLAILAEQLLRAIPHRSRAGNKTHDLLERIEGIRKLRKTIDHGGGYMSILDDREAEDPDPPSHSLVWFVREKVIPHARWHAARRERPACRFAHMTPKVWRVRRARIERLLAEAEVFVPRCAAAAEIAHPDGDARHMLPLEDPVRAT